MRRFVLLFLLCVLLLGMPVTVWADALMGLQPAGYSVDPRTGMQKRLYSPRQIYILATEGNKRALKAIADEQPIDIMDNNKNTAVCYAAYYQNEDALELLDDLDADMQPCCLIRIAPSRWQPLGLSGPAAACRSATGVAAVAAGGRMQGGGASSGSGGTILKAGLGGVAAVAAGVGIGYFIFDDDDPLTCSDMEVLQNGKCWPKMDCQNGSEQQEDVCVCVGSHAGTLCTECVAGYIQQNGICYAEKTCVHGTQQGDACVCNSGYTGDDCSSCVAGYVQQNGICYVERNCSVNGTQIENMCSCTSPYTGDYCTDCETGYTKGSDGVCYLNNDCNGHGNQVNGACVCTGLWKGTNCEACIDGYEKYNGACYAKKECGNGTQQGDTCVCDSGSSLGDDGKCYTTNTCNNHGNQVNGACVCTGLWKGTNCEACIDGYEKYNGACYKKLECGNGTQQGDTCVCDSGSSLGDDGKCYTTNTCNGHGNQVNGACVCTGLWRGTNCEACIDGYEKYNGACYKKLECGNGTQNGDSCDCNTGYTFANGTCELIVLDCGVHGTQNGTACVCESGYKGTYCNECESSDAVMINGICVQKGADLVGSPDTTNSTSISIKNDELRDVYGNKGYHNRGSITVENYADGNVYGLHGATVHTGCSSYGTITIKNYGDGTVYGAYGSNVTTNSANANVDILNTGNGETFGLFSTGSITQVYGTGTEGILTVLHTGEGNTFGMKSSSSSANIINSGTSSAATANVTGVSGQTMGIYKTGSGRVYNAQNGGAGKIVVSLLGSGTVSGIYADGAATVYNSYAAGAGTIDVALDKGRVTEEETKLYGIRTNGGTIINANSTGAGSVTVKNASTLSAPVTEMIGLLVDGSGTIKNATSTGTGTVTITNTGTITGDGAILAGMQAGSGTLDNSSAGTITITNTAENTKAYGMRFAGDTASTGTLTNAGTITLTTLSDEAYGIFSEAKGTITHSGTIKVTNTSTNANQTVGIGSTNSETAINVTGGTITVTGTDEAIGIKGSGDITNAATITVSGAKKSYGIYSDGTGTITNTGAINVEGSEVAYGIYAPNATLNNTGTITLSGSATEVAEIVNGGTVAASYALFMDETISLASNGVFKAPALTGVLSIESDTVLGGFKDTYVQSGALDTTDIGDLTLQSKSAMFTASAQQNAGGTYDVLMTRQSFDKLLAEQSIARFLEENYQIGRNEKLFDALKKAQDGTALNKQVAAVTGADSIAQFNREDFEILRHVNRTVHGALFGDKENVRIMGGADYIHTNRNNDGALSGYSGDGSTLYALADRSLGTWRAGLGVTLTRYSSDYDESDSDRKEQFVQVVTPVGTTLNGVEFWSTPTIGYGYGSYKRRNDATNEGKIKRLIYGVSNEARLPIDVGGLIFEPALELNVTGWHLFDAKETEGANRLTFDDKNALSVEAGVGVRLRKKMDLSVGRLGIEGTGMIYHEFADPYDIRLTMEGMGGHYTVDPDTSRTRGFVQGALTYDYHNIGVYGSFTQYIEKEAQTQLNTGVKLGF